MKVHIKTIAASLILVSLTSCCRDIACEPPPSSAEFQFITKKLVDGRVEQHIVPIGSYQVEYLRENRRIYDSYNETTETIWISLIEETGEQSYAIVVNDTIDMVFSVDVQFIKGDCCSSYRYSNYAISPYSWEREQPDLFRVDVSNQ